MKLFIISSRLDVFSVENMAKEADVFVESVVLATPDDIFFDFKNGKMHLYINGILVSQKDRFIVRSSSAKLHAFMSEFVSAVIHLFGPDKILNGHSFSDWGVMSKFAQLVILQKHGIPVVNSSYGYVPVAREYPHVVKHIFENNGLGVEKVETVEQLDQAQGIYGEGMVLTQELIHKSEDYRIIVLKDKVLGYMKKIVVGDAFVTNIHEGGMPAKVTKAKQEVLGSLALKATHACGFDFAGVDVIFNGSGGPYVLEINPTPGFEGFQSVNDVNVAKELMRSFLADDK